MEAAAAAADVVAAAPPPEKPEEMNEEDDKVSANELLLIKAQRLMDKITSSPNNPSPSVLHALASILEAQESRSIHTPSLETVFVNVVLFCYCENSSSVTRLVTVIFQCQRVTVGDKFHMLRCSIEDCFSCYMLRVIVSNNFIS